MNPDNPDSDFTKVADTWMLKEVVDLVPRHIVTLADTKRILGIRYSDWLLGSPSIETGIAASSMAQDEWGHARLLYSMVKHFDMIAWELEYMRRAKDYCSAPALDEPFADWAAFVAATVVVDGALTTALEAFGSARFEPACARIPKMLAEEEYHWQFGEAWFRQLAGAGGEGADRLRAAAQAMLSTTLGWLLPDDDLYRSLATDLLVWKPERVRTRYEGRVGELLGLVEIDLDHVIPMRGDWDAKRRRSPGAPGEDAVERARGDRNRSLMADID